MSIQEPPGGRQPDGASGYTPPQDPWADGADAGHASAPTDPIPQYSYGTYPTQHSSGEQWASATMPQSGSLPWTTQQAPKKNKIGYVLLGALVLVLAGGGGYLAWYLAIDGGSPKTTPSTQVADATTASATTPASPQSESPTAVVFNPYVVRPGDCLVNRGTPENPKMEVVECASKTYQVLRIFVGSDVLQDGDSKLTLEEAQNTCQGVEGYTNHYASNAPGGTDRDVVFCMSYLP